MISDESGNRFFPTAVTDYWQDRAGIAYQQTDFSWICAHFPIWNCQSRVALPFEWVWVPRNFIISIYSLESFQYPAFATSFINRSTGAVYRSTVFDIYACVTTVIIQLINGLRRIFFFFHDLYFHINCVVFVWARIFCWYLPWKT